jgi:hypothetical protein
MELELIKYASQLAMKANIRNLLLKFAEDRM